ncbi:hypothetical protein H6P81_002327 [Aristolochia fimbriata]|uniref:Uncharacterized protein n=1 Tax=Aristolochia fimbriata TaxID=158543 RepID=A0AAV7FB40_ARIFI|nr:hypothetical protein H6P81_002327 [Aristolochia fimbriata]
MAERAKDAGDGAIGAENDDRKMFQLFEGVVIRRWRDGRLLLREMGKPLKGRAVSVFCFDQLSLLLVFLLLAVPEYVEVAGERRSNWRGKDGGKVQGSSPMFAPRAVLPDVRSSP